MKCYTWFALALALVVFFGVSTIALAGPITVADLTKMLKLGKPEREDPVMAKEPVGPDKDTGPPEPGVPIKLGFRLKFNTAGGALFILDTLPKGKSIADLNKNPAAAQKLVQPSMIGDILVFPPAQKVSGKEKLPKYLNLFSEPFPKDNGVITFMIMDPNKELPNLTLTLAQLQNPANGRNVKYIQEGTLIDLREGKNAPLGNGPRNLLAPPFQIPNLTVFVVPVAGEEKSVGEAYYVFSDTAVPEPGTFVLLSLGGLTMLAGRVVRLKFSGRKQPEPS